METQNMKRPSKETIAKIQSLRGKKGLVAVIEPDTGTYFLGKTLTEALKKAMEKYPGRVFYSIRIGSTFVHEHRGGIKRISEGPELPVPSQSKP